MTTNTAMDYSELTVPDIVEISCPIDGVASWFEILATCPHNYHFGRRFSTVELPAIFIPISALQSAINIILADMSTLCVIREHT